MGASRRCARLQNENNGDPSFQVANRTAAFSRAASHRRLAGEFRAGSRRPASSRDSDASVDTGAASEQPTSDVDGYVRDKNLKA